MGRPKKIVPTEVVVVDSPKANDSSFAETFTPTPEEIEAIKVLRASKTSAPAVDASNTGIDALAKAFAAAIESTRPPVKKTPFNRKPKYTGPKLKRLWQQHGGEIDQRQLYADEIELLNKVKPGVYCK